MAYVTYKNRTSLDYRFTVDTLDDAALIELRKMIAENNKWTYKFNKKVRSGTSRYHTKLKNALRVIVRARGPRPNRYSKDTPRQNATHFDIYVNNRYIYE